MTVTEREQEWIATAPEGPRSRPTVDLSVVLCTWNGERWIRAFLDSLASQEHLPDELLVQDDSSTDGTLDAVEEFARTAPFPVHIEVNRVRLGSTANFERVLSRTAGRCIALADQDDIWYPAKLAQLYGELESDPTLTLAFSDADLIDEDGRQIGARLWDVRLVGRVLRRHPVVPEELFARQALTTGCTMMIRRRAVEAALPFPAELADPWAPMRHDRWLSLVAAAVGTARAVPEPLVGFRRHHQQETGVLLGTQLAQALLRSVRNVLGRESPDHSRSLDARARQLLAAAGRADELGDFEDASRLRKISDAELLRSRIGTDGGLHLFGRAVRAGAYHGDPFLVGSVLADLVRALRPARTSGTTPAGGG